MIDLLFQLQKGILFILLFVEVYFGPAIKFLNDGKLDPSSDAKVLMCLI